MTFDEISKAPQPVQITLKNLLEYDVEVLEITDSALELSEQYLKREILTPKFRDDALHIALASLANVNVLVSWNLVILYIMTRFASSMPLTLKMV